MHLANLTKRKKGSGTFPNPVRAGMVASALDYRWSSHQKGVRVDF